MPFSSGWQHSLPTFCDSNLLQGSIVGGLPSPLACLELLETDCSQAVVLILTRAVLFYGISRPLVPTLEQSLGAIPHHMELECLCTLAHYASSQLPRCWCQLGARYKL